MIHDKGCHLDKYWEIPKLKLKIHFDIISFNLLVIRLKIFSINLLLMAISLKGHPVVYLLCVSILEMELAGFLLMPGIVLFLQYYSCQSRNVEVSSSHEKKD